MCNSGQATRRMRPNRSMPATDVGFKQIATISVYAEPPHTRCVLSTHTGIVLEFWPVQTLFFFLFLSTILYRADEMKKNMA